MKKRLIKIPIPLFLVALVLALVCIVGLVPNAQAVSPPPDGGYPGGNTAEGQKPFKASPPVALTLQLVTSRFLPIPPAVSIPLLALERLTSTSQATIRPPALQLSCLTPPERTTPPME